MGYETVRTNFRHLAICYKIDSIVHRVKHAIRISANSTTAQASNKQKQNQFRRQKKT